MPTKCQTLRMLCLISTGNSARRQMLNQIQALLHGFELKGDDLIDV